MRIQENENKNIVITLTSKEAEMLKNISGWNMTIGEAITEEQFPSIQESEKKKLKIVKFLGKIYSGIDNVRKNVNKDSN